MSATGQLVKRSPRLVACDLGDAPGLCCPVCGMTYVHPEQVAVEQGTTRTTVRCERTQVEPSERGRRGSLIQLDFWCERGHRFRYCLEFHKGQLFCGLFAGEWKEFSDLDELWRS
ncbi:MAG: hypothetical protein KF847_08190 [Pirellulales bacterium]|nr:hypothetical protein [Pirellulales bacterium]